MLVIQGKADTKFDKTLAGACPRPQKRVLRTGVTRASETKTI